MRRRPWLFLFLFALALRLLYLQGWLPSFESHQTPVYGDAAGYYLGAVVLRGGDPGQVTVAQLDSWSNAQWDKRAAFSMMASRGPGYMGFLVGVFSLFGEDPWPVRYVQALLGALTCVFVGLVGRELAGQRAGLVAASLAAIYPSYILFTGRILTEVLASCLLWLGMYGLVRGARARSLGCLLAAGGCLSAAVLARPTLLATIPFLPVAVAVMLRCPRWNRRLLLTAAFSLTLLAPVVSWNVVSRGLSRESPIAGVSGFETVFKVMRNATAPNRRGWSTNLEWKSGREDTPTERPLYLLPAGLNLIMYHLWHVDDHWREARPWMRGLQRFVVVLALAGLGLSLLRWRDFAPLLGCLAALAVASIKWIEIRPNLPFMPILFILVGLSVVTLLDRARVHHRSLGLAAIATGVLLYVCQLFPLARLFPNTSPTSLGLVSDQAVLAVALGWGALLWHVLSPTISRGRAAVAAWIPALLFVLLFGSYTYVRSEPRWRAWNVDLAELGDGIVQTVGLPVPVPADRIKSAVWLVDLQTPSETPPLRVGLNGTWLEPSQYSWRRLFCPDDGSIPTARWRKRCRIYREGISGFTAAFEASPQWWGLEMDPRLVGGKASLSLRLSWNGGAGELGSVGGTFSPSDRGRQVYGPSLFADRIGTATSLYRWHVAHDWRLWETNQLDAGGGTSRLDRDSLRVPWSPRLDYISNMMRRNEAYWNVRLRLVTIADRQLFF